MKSATHNKSTWAAINASFKYQDPYQPNGGLNYNMMNKWSSYWALREMEREFADFSSIKSTIDSQFKEIYRSVFKAYSNNDKVDIFRGLSEPLYHQACELRGDSKPNPFLMGKVADLNLSHCQARIMLRTDDIIEEKLMN